MNKEIFSDIKCYSFPLVLPGVCVFYIALISSMVLVGIQPAIEIRRPWILLLVSVASLFPVKDKSFSILQKLLIAYFLCMLLNQLTLERMVLGGQTLRLILPQSVIPLFFYAVAFILTISTDKVPELVKQNQLWYRLWGGTGIILVAHMTFLWISLKSIYGYGYAHNINVLGNMVLYIMCFIFTWDILDRPMVRGFSFGCIMTYLLLLIIF